jgi:hypothetical protein
LPLTRRPYERRDGRGRERDRDEQGNVDYRHGLGSRAGLRKAIARTDSELRGMSPAMDGDARAQR